MAKINARGATVAAKQKAEHPNVPGLPLLFTLCSDGRVLYRVDAPRHSYKLHGQIRRGGISLNARDELLHYLHGHGYTTEASDDRAE